MYNLEKKNTLEKPKHVNSLVAASVQRHVFPFTIIFIRTSYYNDAGHATGRRLVASRNCKVQFLWKLSVSGKTEGK